MKRGSTILSTPVRLSARLSALALQIDKILMEVAGETLSQMAAAPARRQQVQQQQPAAAEEEEEEELAGRLADIRT